MAQYVADVGNTDTVVENERLFPFQRVRRERTTSLKTATDGGDETSALGLFDDRSPLWPGRGAVGPIAFLVVWWAGAQVTTPSSLRPGPTASATGTFCRLACLCVRLSANRACGCRPLMMERQAVESLISTPQGWVPARSLSLGLCRPVHSPRLGGRVLNR
jgi:hypothetical protein